MFNQKIRQGGGTATLSRINVLFLPLIFYGVRARKNIFTPLVAGVNMYGDGLVIVTQFVNGIVKLVLNRRIPFV